MSLKYLLRPKICKILSSNNSTKSLSIEFNQEGENLKVSTQRNSTEFCFPPDREYILIFVRFFKYFLGNFIRSIFNFVLSQILPIFAACEKKVLETSGFASCFVCHFLPPVRPSQNFPKLSVATNTKNHKQKY